VEYYKEFFGNDICQSEPEACQWLRRRFAINSDYVTGKIDDNKDDDPFWHQVHLFYQQMRGINKGITDCGG